MARPKRRTAQENFFFSGTPLQEPGTELCTLASMPCPARIMDDPMKKQLWDFICADMENRRCLSVTYALLVAELVEVVSTLHECRQKVSEEGMIVNKYDSDGNFLGSQPSPYFNILSRQQPVLLKILEKIGMSPRDITYLVNPEATAHQAIEAVVTDRKAITYFRS